MPQDQNLLDQVPCGIFSFTEDGIITYANAYCCKLLQYEPQQLIGTAFSSLLTISGKIFYETHFYPLVKMHHHFEEIFLILQTRSGKDLPVLMNALTITTGPLPEIVCSFIQVFNRRKYEDEILTARKAAEDSSRQDEAVLQVKGELERQQLAMNQQINRLQFQNNELVQVSDIITHDLQEPVRKVMVYANELSQPDGNLVLKARAASSIQKSAERIRTLLHNLQNYLGLSLPAELNEQVDLAELLHYELTELKRMHPQTEVEFTCEGLSVITGNKRQLAEMMRHLLKNAFEHGTIDNHLHLEVTGVIIKQNVFSSLEDRYKYTDYIKIILRDRGPGFENMYNEYIFEVLKKLTNDNTAAGFGLALCKRIAENHFGSIEASGTLGGGASFIILLPVNTQI